jgi:hypothetical protein
MKFNIVKIAFKTIIESLQSGNEIYRIPFYLGCSLNSFHCAWNFFLFIYEKSDEICLCVCDIIVVNISYYRTFTYIEREIEKVPSHIPVLVLGNHRDMGHHRTVTEDKARYFCNHFDRWVCKWHAIIIFLFSKDSHYYS